MHTNYKKLNSFEAATVGLTVCGVAIIGLVFYSTLPTNQQKYVADSLMMLDIHEQALPPIEGTMFVFESVQDFMDEFYVAFGEMASLPADVFELPNQLEKTYMAMLQFSDYMASDFQQRNTSHTALAYGGGVVSGMTLDLSFDIASEDAQVGGCGGDEIITEDLNIPYSFQPLEKDFWKENIYIPLSYNN